MAAEWFYEVDGQEHGPVTGVQLKQLAVNGFLQPTHLIWKEGVPKRVPARSVKGLFTPAQLATAAPRKPAADATPRPAKPASPPKKVEEELVALEPVEEEVVLEPVEEVVDLEAVEVEEPAPAPTLPPPPGSLAQVAVTYRGGHPGLPAPLAGSLYLEAAGLCFASAGRPEVRFPFAQVDAFPEPGRGEFPEAMKKGQAGTPYNRLTVTGRLGHGCREVFFDVHGATREAMDEGARNFFKRVSRQRDVPKPPAAAPRAAVPPAPSGAGFRVLRDGRPQGPYSVEEIRRMLAGGQLQALDMVGVEIWVPLATLGGLLLAGGGTAVTGARSAPGPVEEELEARPVEDEPPAPPLARADDGNSPLPVDADLLDFGKGSG